MNFLKKVISNHLYAISIYARQISGTLILFIIARYMSVFDFGLFSSYKNIATFCLLFANLGVSDYILISSKGEENEVRSKIAFFILNGINVLLLVSVFSLFFKLDNYLIFILVLIRTFFDTVFFSLILPFFQATKKFNVIAIINLFYAFILCFIALISYYFKLSLLNFLILNIFLGLVNFVQCSYYSKINYIKVLFSIKSFCKKLDKSIFSYMGVVIAFYIYSQIPALFVSTYLEKEQVALYFSAFTIASIIGLLITAQNQKIVPEMINAPVEKVKKLISKNFTFIMSINTILFCIFALFGKVLLKMIYGQDFYSNGYFLLLIFTLGNISLALANIYGGYITASGNQQAKIPRQIETIFISIILLLLLHKFGVYAAAISYLLSATYIGFRYTTLTLKLLKEK